MFNKFIEFIMITAIAVVIGALFAIALTQVN